MTEASSSVESSSGVRKKLPVFSVQTSLLKRFSFSPRSLPGCCVLELIGPPNSGI